MVAPTSYGDWILSVLFLYMDVQSENGNFEARASKSMGKIY